MFDVILRALKHPLDYIPVLNRRTLELQEIRQESDHIYSFIFKGTRPFFWLPGQHGIFYFPGARMQGRWWRAFSIASSPHEHVIKISTIISDAPSDFKAKLKAMQKGDRIHMQGPFGEFHTKPSISRIIGIAGGIGITPFRPLIKDIASGAIAETQLTLIYGSKDVYTFKEELDALSAHSCIDIIYTVTPEELNTTLEAHVTKNGNSASYFISGSPGMIKAVRTTLKSKGIRHIVNDTFTGY